MTEPSGARPAESTAPEAADGSPASIAPRASRLALIIPTYNERANLPSLVAAVERALPGIAWELIVVDDDSPDGTAALARDMARADARLHCLQRLDRRGLSTACIEGILASTAPVVGVMDADLQHDPALLLPMLQALEQDEVELCIGSRYVQGGSATSGLSPGRQRISELATRLGSLFLKSRVSDPMSGFFLLRRNLFEECMHRLSGKGYKLLLDILMAARRPVAFREFAYRMRPREHGETKLDSLVALEYLLLLLDRLLGRVIPARFALFLLVGLSGVAVHLAVLGTSFRLLDSGFEFAQVLATICAMSSNFLLNNALTYRDRRIRGLGLIRGLLSFYLACSLGAVINVMLASTVFAAGIPWWLAGLIGAGVASVWNYAVTSVLTWNRIR